MAIPTECKMPDLSSLDHPLIGSLIVLFLVGEKGVSRKASLYRRDFIRLMSKALFEYNEAREAILADIAEPNRPVEEMEKHGRQLHIISFTNHIETCINAISRLYRLLERIKSEKESPTFPRELRRLLETKSKSITSFRDTIEHMDERIQKGEITPGTPVMVTVSKDNDTIVVSKYRINFSELATVVQKMYEIALYILEVNKT